MNTIEKHKLDEVLRGYDILDINSATIRQILAVAHTLEGPLGEKFVHLELGNPGLPPEQIGIEAQCRALHSGVSNKYPDITGIPEIKNNGSAFLKAFLDIDVPGKCIVPTVGSMQACFSLLLLLGQRLQEKDTILFIDPGFSAQHHQAKILGLKTRSFDIYDYRGEALRDKLEEMLADGRVTAMIYSSPNNPAWINLTETELSIIGEMATRHDAIVLEDLAYLGMDFRSDLSVPGQPPFIPTVARYTDNYILLVSASKIFSYAGERIAMVCMSPQVHARKYDFFASFYDMPSFGDAYTYGVLYASSSGVSHSAQHAMAAMLGAAVEGKLDFVGACREYGRRARHAKEVFTRHGFHPVYAVDGDCPISDGFFFTMGYKDMPGDALQLELMRYGISTIPLKPTGSDQPGVRVTVSMLCSEEDFERLDQRLKAFDDEH